MSTEKSMSGLYGNKNKKLVNLNQPPKYAKGGSVAQYRLVPYKQRMEGYIESVGEKQVVLSTTYDGAWEKANELLSSDKDFDTVYVEKLGKSVLSGKILGSVSLRGIIKYADGGGVGVGRFKLMYKIEGQEQSEIRELEEEATDAARRYSKLGYTNIRIIDLNDESGKEYFFKDGGGVDDDIRKVICDNCDWEWNFIDSDKDAYMCHKCGTDNTPMMADGGMMDVVNTEVISIKGNIMGTTSLELKIKGMKKYQDFIVYPISADEAGKPITIQSDTRFGYMDLSSGRGLMSQSHSNGAYSYHFSSDRKVPFKISEIDVQKIKQHLSSRAGSKVGNSVVFSDNSGAGMMADGGSVKRANNSLLLKYANFEDNWHINLLELNPYRNQSGLRYKGENKYAVTRVTPKGAQEMKKWRKWVGIKDQLFEFKTLEDAENKFNKLVELSKTFSPIRSGSMAAGGKIDGGKGSEWAFWAGLLGWGVLSYIGINKK